MNTKTILLLLPFILLISSCSKDFRGGLVSHNRNLQIPIIRIDKHFPNGILQFGNKESFKAFYEKVEQNPDYVNQILPNFKSFQKVLDHFASKQSLPVKNKQTTSITQSFAADPVVSQEEYLIVVRNPKAKD